jgi:hypothetical protein
VVKHLATVFILKISLFVVICVADYPLSIANDHNKKFHTPNQTWYTKYGTLTLLFNAAISPRSARPFLRDLYAR